MRAGSLAIAFAVFTVGVTALDAASGASVAQTEVAPATLGSELRYIGRDGATGMSARVDDRFIAEVEEDVARYGQDRRDPVPPPAPRGPEPARLLVAALGIDAPVARLGRDAYGRLDVPQDRTTVGWNPGDSDAPGEGRSTFLAAHYTYGGLAGVFYRLSTLRPGSIIEAQMDDGTSHTYKVRSTLDYELGVIDMGALLGGREGTESLVLMTCSGPVVDGVFQLRTVVLADRVS